MRETNKKRKDRYCLTLFLLRSGMLFIVALFFLISGDFFVYAEDDEKEMKEKIEKYEDKLKKVKKEKKEEEGKKLRISSEIASIQGNINIIESELLRTKKNLQLIAMEIVEVEKELKYKKELLGEAIIKMNQLDVEAGMMLMGKIDGLGAYFAAIDNMEQLEEELFSATQGVKEEQEKFEKKKEEQKLIYEMQDDQKKSLEYEENKKRWALNKTQEEINEKSVTIGQIQTKISKLKSNLSKFLGKAYDASDIKEAAKFASKVTGVRRDFLMGMLVVESDLGRYTGGCTYKQVEDGAKKAYKKKKLSKTAWKTFKRRKDIFKDIAKELDYNYKKRKVSCNPASYAGTGGAMGVAQFMPDTWIGYKSRISRVTGHKPPDPWNLTDGVVAMALKLGVVPGVTDHKKSAEKKAAKLYLSGTTSGKYDWYGDKVLYWAKNYKQLLD